MLNPQYSAILIGSTGLVGSEILKLLIQDNRCQKIVCFTRKELILKNDKIKNFIIDFNNISAIKDEIKGDILFSALGTTKKMAGSIEAQRIVDVDYQFNFAKFAKDNGTKSLVLISASMADPKSTIPYSKMKGELEDKIKDLKFEQTIILRPSFLDGDRAEFRLGEKMALPILRLIPNINLLSGLRPVHASQVARSAYLMHEILNKGVHILEHKDILKI